MPAVKHVPLAELEAGLEIIRQSPKAEGLLAMIVCRPAVGENAQELSQPGWSPAPRHAADPHECAGHCVAGSRDRSMAAGG